MRAGLFALAPLLAVLVAAPAWGGPTKTLVQPSAPCHRASAWSPEGKPTLETPVVIPAGKTLELARECDTGPLLLQGSIVGQQPLHVAGNVTVDGGSFDTKVPLTLYGLGTLDFGGAKAPDLYIEGAVELAGPLYARSININGGFYTNGWPVRSDAEVYTHIKYPIAHLWLGTSTVTAPIFESYEPEQTEQFSAEATVTVCATSRSTGGFVKVGEGGAFYGAEQVYGTVNLGCIEPFSATNYEVGTLRIEPSDGPAIFSGGSTVTTHHLEGAGEVLDGEPGQPSASRPAVIVCGCTPPASLRFGPGVEVR